MKIFTSSTCDLILKELNNDARGVYFTPDGFKKELIEYLRLELNFPEPDSLLLDSKPGSDCENSIKVFEYFRNLNATQANDKRLWVTLTHTHFFKYTIDRWNISDQSSLGALIDRFHFEGSGLAARMRNSISRLWWSAYLTFDQTRDDNFELTKLLWSKQDIYMGLVERKIGTYNTLVRGFLEFYAENKFLKEDDIRKLFTALNATGGVKPLAAHSKDEIKQLLNDFVQFYGFKK